MAMVIRPVAAPLHARKSPSNSRYHNKIGQQASRSGREAPIAGEHTAALHARYGSPCQRFNAHIQAAAHDSSEPGPVGNGEFGIQRNIDTGVTTLTQDADPSLRAHLPLPLVHGPREHTNGSGSAGATNCNSAEIRHTDALILTYDIFQLHWQSHFTLYPRMEVTNATFHNTRSYRFHPI
jgi:hypothetical protein